MSKILASNPTAVDWRNVAIGLDSLGLTRRHQMDLYVTNTGDASLSITSLAMTTGTKFSADVVGGQTFPIALAPGQNLQLRLQFFPVPGDEDVQKTDTLTINSDADNHPYTVSLFGIGRATGIGGCLYFSPSSWFFNWINGQNYLAGTDIGLWSNPLNLLLVNGGDDLLTISHITPKWPFRLVAPLPELPAVIAPASSLLVHVEAFIEIPGVTVYPEFLEIINNGIQPIAFYGGSVTGIGVTSASNVTGTKVALAAIGNTLKRFDPSDLAPERPASLVKVFDMGIGRNEKLLARIMPRYEDLGAGSFKTTVKTTDQVSTPVTSSIGTVGADGLIKHALVEKQLNEDVFEVTIEHVSGPLSFVDFEVDYEPRGPVVD
jgi:hypothetical protein